MLQTPSKLFVFFLLLCLSVGARAAEAPPEFTDWVADLRAEARARGISEATLDAAFDDIVPIPRVIELDRKQPEFTQTFWTYLQKRVNNTRIERGRQMLKTHAALFKRVQDRFGVQPRFLVAFWGLETNFGDYLGSFPVIGSLSTLAYDPRRSEFFRAELLAALQILEDGDIGAPAMKGSWAGAMGQPQFMPTTFVRYAIDDDGDGRRDIWTSLPDVFASAANYLSRAGWREDETWGREVRLPAGFDISVTGMDTRKSLSQWQSLGVRRADGSDLPIVQGMTGSIILPAGHKGPAFLVYGNFRTIMVWNRSILYALAVGHLADRIVGLPRLASKPNDDDKPLSRQQVMAIQSGLNRRGFDAGEPDGVVGPMTRIAIRDYQRANGLPPDGYADLALWQRLNAP